MLQIGGNASETEYSFIEVKTQEKIDATKMNNYIIEEIRWKSYWLYSPSRYYYLPAKQITLLLSKADMAYLLFVSMDDLQEKK